MRESFQKGVYPVMLTPFTEENRIDEDALGKLEEKQPLRALKGYVIPTP